MKVLLSIKPDFVEKISDGSKQYEFRRELRDRYPGVTPPQSFCYVEA